jgi:hypothetical protein
MYALEETLVQDFLRVLAVPLLNPWGPVRAITEFFYARGRTDVVAMTKQGELIAFEAKLKRWKDALDQAYRNTCFSHLSYILLPEKTAYLAASYAADFSVRGVGICSLVAGKIEIVYDAKKLTPLQEWLSKRAQTVILERSII